MTGLISAAYHYWRGGIDGNRSIMCQVLTWNSTDWKRLLDYKLNLLIAIRLVYFELSSYNTRAHLIVVTADM